MVPLPAHPGRHGKISHSSGTRFPLATCSTGDTAVPRATDNFRFRTRATLCGSQTNNVRHEKRRGHFSLSPREERAGRELERGELKNGLLSPPSPPFLGRRGRREALLLLRIGAERDVKLQPLRRITGRALARL